MKAIISVVAFVSLTAQAQIQNRVVESRLNMREAIVSRTIDMKLNLGTVFRLLPVTDTNLKTQYIAKLNTSLQCNLILDSSERTIADWAEVTTLSGWVSNQLKSEETQSNLGQVMQKVSVKFRLAAPDSKELELSCSKRIGTMLTEGASCRSGGLDESLEAKGIRVCKERMDRMTYEHLVSELNSVLINLNIDLVIKKDYKILTVQSGEIPAS